MTRIDDTRLIDGKDTIQTPIQTVTGIVTGTEGTSTATEIDTEGKMTMNCTSVKEAREAEEEREEDHGLVHEVQIAIHMNGKGTKKHTEGRIGGTERDQVLEHHKAAKRKKSKKKSHASPHLAFWLSIPTK